MCGFVSSEFWEIRPFLTSDRRWVASRNSGSGRGPRGGENAVTPGLPRPPSGHVERNRGKQTQDGQPQRFCPLSVLPRPHLGGVWRAWLALLRVEFWFHHCLGKFLGLK